MPALTIIDLENGKKDLDHIAEIATSGAATAADRTGNVKPTVKGAIDGIRVFNLRGAFTGGAAYSIKDVYTSGGIAYVALVDHVATTVGADLAAAKVAVHQGATREDLATAGGADLIGFPGGRTVFDKLSDIINRADYPTDADFNIAKAGKASIDGTGRLRTPGIIAGTEELLAPTTRDAFVAGRTVLGATDCHGFSDRTVIDNVTDAGTYGCFDTTLKLRGSNVQNHVYSFQDRVDYQGSGTLENQAGLYSTPTFSGSGTWQNRYGAYIDNLNKTGTGTVQAQIGVYIRDLNAATTNVALNMEQTTGYAIYAAGGAKSYHKGAMEIGKGENADGVMFAVQGAVGGARGFLHSTSSTVQLGGIGANVPLQVVNNGAVRVEITDSAGAYAFRPGADNTQPLGDVTKRWNALYAGSGTINTSDAREKQQVRPIDAAILRAWARVEFCMFKFNEAVERKGDGARWHIGAIAQRVKEAFEAEGLDPFAYGLLCYDEWEAKPADGTPLGTPIAAGNRYGIRYEEALALECAYLRSRLDA